MDNFRATYINNINFTGAVYYSTVNCLPIVATNSTITNMVIVFATII